MDILVIVIPVLCLAAGFVIFTSLRRREAGSATGHLSRETRARDRKSRKPNALLEGTTGREVERAAQLARKGGDLVPVRFVESLNHTGTCVTTLYRHNA